MNKLGSIFTLLWLGYASASYAADENHTLHVYVTNDTADILYFDHIEDRHPGNHYAISLSVINPGESTVITVEKLTNNDIFGNVFFTTQTGIDIPLLILDQEQIHFGQPIFSVNNVHHHSILISKTRNQQVGPRYLTYLAASLKIMQN